MVANVRTAIAMTVAVLFLGACFVACAAFSGSENPQAPSEAGTNAGDALPNGQDASPNPAALDSGADAPSPVACHGAFGTPALVLAHSDTQKIDTVTLTTDELDAFVTLAPTDATIENRNVYAMHRDSTNIAFVLDMTKRIPLADTGETPGAFDVGLSADDDTLYFTHREDPDGGDVTSYIYQAVRTNPQQVVFGSAAKFATGINDPATVQFHPHPAGPSLYFTVASISGAERDLYVAPLNGGARNPISELNAARSLEANPVPSRDERSIFFSSDRASDAGVNSIYEATRASAALTFTVPPNLISLSVDAAASVTPQHLSADGCRLYFSVDRLDLYVAQRAP